MRTPAAKRALRDRRGVAALEFAIVLPFLMLMMVGCYDVVYLHKGRLRVQSTATQIGQIISQCKSVGAADEAQIFALAQRTLGRYAASGKKWGVTVTAIRTNSRGQARQVWSMDNRGTAGSGASFTADGATLPPGYTLRSDQIVFRTEIFSQVDATLLSRANSLLAPFMSARPAFDTASSSLLHVSRTTDADKLNTKTSSEACFS